MSEKTKKYVVTTAGLHLDRKAQEKGTIIELTDKQAASLVNKVQLESEFIGTKKGSNADVQKVQTKLDKSEEAVETLTTELEKANEELTAANELLDGDVAAELVVAKSKIELYEAFVVELAETYDDADMKKSIKALDKSVKAVK